jgi:nucleotide-binding universal stress UspA family protein
MRSGPLVIGYDGTRASEQALREAAELLPGRAALVVCVWKPGLAYELVALPATGIGLPPAPLDLRTALDVDRSMFEGAQRAAGQAAALANELGLQADGVAVAEEAEITVAETLIRLARERDAQALVVGSHAHGGLLGATARAVIRQAPCPVVLVREH